jgi:hypothetical protein
MSKPTYKINLESVELKNANEEQKSLLKRSQKDK